MFKIKPLPKRLCKTFWGMNPAAARELKVKGLSKCIYINPEAKGWFRKRVIKHERIEYAKMRKGLRYKRAHAYAEKHEF